MGFGSSFLAKGFPTIKEEEWKYTSLKNIVAESFSVEENGTAISKGDIEKYILFLFLACHQRGVIHRDIKDENLLVTISPHSKPKIELIDFGSGAHIGVNEIYFDFDGKSQSYFHI